MSWTKRQLIEEAYSELGLADYVFDLQPEDLQSALRKMDAMIARWSGKGVKIRYPLPGSPENSELDTETNMPDAAAMAVYLGLALLIAPGLGKIPAPDTKKAAKSAYKDLSTFTSFIPERQYPSKFPAGEGNKPYRYTNRTFLPRPQIDCDAGSSNR